MGVRGSVCRCGCVCGRVLSEGIYSNIRLVVYTLDSSTMYTQQCASISLYVFFACSVRVLSRG